MDGPLLTAYNSERKGRMHKKCHICLITSCIFFFIWIAFYLPIQYSIHLHRGPNYGWMLRQNDLRQYIVPLNDTTILNPASACTPDQFLLIFVCSSITNFKSRQAIRDTWARSSLWSTNVRVFFLLGRSYNYTVDARVRLESQSHSDIIQEDFLDVYNNLTLKSVMMLKWVNGSCSHVRFVLKTDDDMFVHIPNLVKYLTLNGTDNLLAGYLIKNALPVKDWNSKWYVPSEVFPFQKYPDYLSGTGYVMSGKLVPPLYAMALRTKFFYLEDIFLTGICAQKLRLRPTNHLGFSYIKRPNDPCIFRSIITAHRMTTMELYSTWLQIHNSSIHC